MKVIITRNVEHLGKPGDVVEVKDGFARNYLFPKKLAIPATQANIKGLEKSQRHFSRGIEKRKKMSEQVAEKLNNLSVKTKIKIGIDGKSFGSINAHDIVELLKKENIEIDKKQVLLDEPIRHPGIYDISVRLSQHVSAVFKLVVIEEGEKS